MIVFNPQKYKKATKKLLVIRIISIMLKKKTVDAIVKSNLLGTREKSALLCGMIYYSDDISIRIKLMQLMSDMSLTREESREINILATCGKRGHLEKGIKPLRWPFIVSWRKKHGR